MGFCSFQSKACARYARDARKYTLSICEEQFRVAGLQNWLVGKATLGSVW
jgi:hypothetical protein